jgi:hypothetical protein
MRASTKRARAARAMVMVTRVGGNKEAIGPGGKSNGNGNKGGKQATVTRAKATATTWAIEMATRVAGDIEGNDKGGKGNGNGNEGSGWQKG